MVTAVAVVAAVTTADDRDERFTGYAQARVRVEHADGVLVVRPRAVGTTVGPFPFDAPVHVLTAHDPGPARLSAAENAARQAALEARLHAEGVATWPALAGAEDGAHAERSALVVGLTDARARALAAAWGQDAIFRWSATAWSILPCDRADPLHLGWELGREAQRSSASISGGTPA